MKYQLSLLTLCAMTIASTGCTFFNKTGGPELSVARTERTTDYGAGGNAYDRYSVEDAIAERQREEARPRTVEDFVPEKSFQRISQRFATLRGRGWNPTAAKQAFISGDEVYRSARDSGSKEQFLQAAEFYAMAAERWPESALEEDALFKAGECYFFSDHYDDANEQYEILVKNHPNTRHLDLVESRRFLIAKYWLDVHERSPDSLVSLNFFDETRPLRDADGHAIRVFDAIRIDDPTGKLADDATIAAAHAILDTGDYDRADQYFSDLIQTFPTSEHQFAAHLLAIQTKIRKYDGPDYEGSALVEAEELIKRVRIQFRAKSEQNSEFLDRAEATVKKLLAEREYELGTYYDRRGEYAGARYHYQNLIEKYPETPVGKLAQQRFDVIAERPNAPLDRAAWLTAWLPKDNDDRLGSIEPDGDLR